MSFNIYRHICLLHNTDSVKAMGFIYKLTFPSEKSYIGQTIQDIEKRFQAHQYDSSGCVAVCNAIKKYGWENVKKEWYEIPDEDLNFYEEMLVALLGTLSPGGYNLMEGGGSKGRPSEESKKKMSEAQTGEKNPNYGRTGKKHPMYGRTGEKHPMYGNNHTEETKKKISEAHIGKTLSDEHRQKMSDAKSGEKNHNSKKVYQYTIDGTYVGSYGSSGEAARALEKTDGTLIRKCARGKLPSAYGFKWSREKL
ncbi:GIY-YIG catalytic domain-containing endonuclease [Paramecium bursaria Chlorella virus Fr5L]|nr:GIY-YIG catalytic domain-containing endonuclease [Paramecium bursaria Chlorella virus Fr5L]